MIDEEFFYDLLPEGYKDQSALTEAAFSSDNALVLRRQSGATQEVHWNVIASRIPGLKHVPTHVFVDHDSDSIGLLFRGTAEDGFLRARKADLTVVRVGVLTSEGYRRLNS